MKANRTILAAAALLCMPFVALAQTVDEKSFSKTAIAGKASIFDVYYAVKLDCTPIEWVEVRIVQQPESGKAEISRGSVLMQYPDANPRKSCNGKPTMAKRLVYTPDKKATGEDKVVVEVVTSSGSSYRRVYDITVM
jgi:hypothetical protein